MCMCVINVSVSVRNVRSCFVRAAIVVVVYIRSFLRSLVGRLYLLPQHVAALHGKDMISDVAYTVSESW
jgi:hypothetical protein